MCTVLATGLAWGPGHLLAQTKSLALRGYIPEEEVTSATAGRTPAEIRRAQKASIRRGEVPIIEPNPDVKNMPPEVPGENDTETTATRKPRVGSPIGGNIHTEKGPEGVTDGQAENVVPSNKVVGAANALACHPTSGDTIYVGAANGGVWKTTNATSLDPTWTPLTDAFGSLSIGALEFDPTDATSNTLVAGIGRTSSLGSIGGSRIGVLRTTDGGTNWFLLAGSGGTLTGKNIVGIAARGAVIVVAVNAVDSGLTGIYRSTNTGATFVRISNDGSSGLPTGNALDLQGDPGNTANLYAAISGSSPGVYKSTNSGATWTIVSDATMNGVMGSPSKVEMAVGNSNNVYCAVVTSGKLAQVFRSGNGGSSWAGMGTGTQLPGTTEGGTFYGIHVGGQGSIHLSIAADPTNANVVYIGGDRQPAGNELVSSSFPNSIGAVNYSGRLFRGDASQALGSQWVHLTHSSSLGASGGGTLTNSAPHADSRDMAFAANGRLIEADDGGVYARTSPANNSGSWLSLQGTLKTSEVHDVAYDSISNKLIAGTQDTGTPIMTSSNSWDSYSTGDGGDVAVDNITLAGINRSIRYTSYQNLSGLNRATYNSSGNFVSSTGCSLTVGTGGAISVQFYTPVELNKVNPSRLLIGAKNGIYESLDQGATCNRPDLNSVWAGDGLSGVGLAYGGRQGGTDFPDVIYGVDGADIAVRTTSGGSFTTVNISGQNGGDLLLDVALDSTDYAKAYIVDRNQVFRSTNTGATWTDITGDLTGVGSFRCVEFVPTTAGGAVVVGTQTGVYVAQAATPTSWNRLGTNMPTAAYVFDLDYNAPDNVLAAGSLGRGIWQLSNASTVITGSGVGEWVNY
ncbi:MAG: hypothetical protein K1X53_04470 [Candidatus Sumerlaeaceae bacterium]|nr:hypothetical protein [Candidatus Sumerlaeaceae bacterium]